MKNYFYYLGVFLFFSFFSLSLWADNCNESDLNLNFNCANKASVLQRCRGKDNYARVEEFLTRHCGNMGEQSQTECVAGHDGSREGTRQTGSADSSPAGGAAGSNR